MKFGGDSPDERHKDDIGQQTMVDNSETVALMKREKREVKRIEKAVNSDQLVSDISGICFRILKF